MATRSLIVLKREDFILRIEMKTQNKSCKKEDRKDTKNIMDLSDEEFRRKLHLTKGDFVEMMELVKTNKEVL